MRPPPPYRRERQRSIAEKAPSDRLEHMLRPQLRVRLVGGSIVNLLLDEKSRPVGLGLRSLGIENDSAYVLCTRTDEKAA
jgi:hypothetical protein